MAELASAHQLVEPDLFRLTSAWTLDPALDKLERLLAGFALAS